MLPVERITLLACAVPLLAGAAGWIVYKARVTPAEREQRRRAVIQRHGRMTDGVVTDVGDGVLFYAYQVHGVEYGASQDVSHLRAFLPPDLAAVVGPVTVKYSPRNPANSLVVCEGWTGLRPPAKIAADGR